MVVPLFSEYLKRSPTVKTNGRRAKRKSNFKKMFKKIFFYHFFIHFFILNQEGQSLIPISLSSPTFMS